jgi:hypothetical protein
MLTHYMGTLSRPSQPTALKCRVHRHFVARTSG